MDGSTTVNPVGSVAATNYARPAVVANVGAAAPELPEIKAANRSLNEPGAPTAPTSANANITRTITIDPQSREVIYRVIDARTRQVLWQLPDAALLRSKAYGQTLINASQRDLPKNQTDIER